MTTVKEFYIPIDGIQLHCRLHTPDICKTHSGVIILVHGLLDTKDSPLIVHLQQTLPYQTLSFDYPGNGQSTGTTTYGNYYTEATYLHHLIQHIQQTTLKLHCLGIIAHSKGASSMFLFAYKYPEHCPQMLINISARFWLSREPSKRWTKEQLMQLETTGRFLWRTYGVDKREYWVDKIHLQERRMTDMSVIQGIDLHKCSVLNLMGARDKIVPVEDCWEYDRLLRLAAPDASKVVTKVVPFASHFWATPPELAELSRITGEWIDKQI